MSCAAEDDISNDWGQFDVYNVAFATAFGSVGSGKGVENYVHLSRDRWEIDLTALRMIAYLFNHFFDHLVRLIRG